jgi:hypothetical protein
VDSGEKIRFSIKDVGADIWSHDRTYDPSCHSGRTDSSPNVRSMCDRETLFSPTVSYLLFPCSRVVFSKNRTDDKSFISIRGCGTSMELHGGSGGSRISSMPGREGREENNKI